MNIHKLTCESLSSCIQTEYYEISRGVRPVAYTRGYKTERESPVGSLLSTERGTTSVPADRRRMRLMIKNSSPLNASKMVESRTVEYPLVEKEVEREVEEEVEKEVERSCIVQRRPSA